MILYHLTTKSNVESIMKNGLIPQIGKNSSFFNETKPCIYLSNLEDIHIWAITFKEYDTVIALNVEEDKVSEYQYSIYSEFICEHTIPSPSIIGWKNYKYERTEKVDKFYIYILSKISAMSKKVIVYNKRSNNFKDTIKSIQLMLNLNIQFKDLYTQEQLSEIFMNQGDKGLYTIFDTGIKSGMKMYEELLTIHNEVTDSLYRYIIEQFYDCLSLDTGGWE